MIGCDAELRNRKAGRLRRLRYLILQPSKPKNSHCREVKLIVATDHFISILCLTLSVGAALNKNLGLCYEFFEFIILAPRVQILCLFIIVYHRISMSLPISTACSNESSNFNGTFLFKNLNPEMHS
jgi:hypothetical protein